MSAMFASGRMIDLILGLTLAEGIAIIVYHRRTSRGPAPADMLPTLAAGFCLLGALRCAIAGWGWLWMGASLAGALVAHLADLSRRWRS